jgi:H+/Cl- antiporter ClcA
MIFRLHLRRVAWLARYVARWLVLATPVGVVVGSAVALFLWALDEATAAQTRHSGLLYMLPLAGLVVGFLYHRFGGEAEGGSNLLIDRIHEPGGGVPARMAPLVLVATVVTHLFGGSAGREGTAVQMGGSIASTLARPLGLGAGELRTLLMAGIAAGFGAVFGTPVAGAVFAVEVLVIGRIESASLFPVLDASFVGDATTAAWGIGHTEYRIDALTPGPLVYAQPVVLAKVAGAAIVFGLASVVFAEMTHGLTRVFKRCIAHRPFGSFVGGLIVIALVHLLGTHAGERARRAARRTGGPPRGDRPGRGVRGRDEHAACLHPHGHRALRGGARGVLRRGLLRGVPVQRALGDLPVAVRGEEGRPAGRACRRTPPSVRSGRRVARTGPRRLISPGDGTRPGAVRVGTRRAC